MKTCSKCKELKELNEFNKKSSAKDGLQARCKICNSNALKEHYNANLDYYKAKGKISRDLGIERYRLIVLEATFGGCVDCGENDVRVLEFDHLNDKSFSIGSAGKWKSEAALRAEIAKCEVVCANCHKIRTWDRADSWRKHLVRKPIPGSFNGKTSDFESGE